ncbi:hypothetical protein WN944_011911 [Citrus x changshan-huyou]|uniref:Uncharacterized protein n=1 Tax=Citrus x changshan-huyou TaxID=2935761 RepID=A0AAP0QYC0_9ROSI
MEKEQSGVCCCHAVYSAVPVLLCSVCYSYCMKFSSVLACIGPDMSFYFKIPRYWVIFNPIGGTLYCANAKLLYELAKQTRAKIGY